MNSLFLRLSRCQDGEGYGDGHATGFSRFAVFQEVK